MKSLLCLFLLFSLFITEIYTQENALSNSRYIGYIAFSGPSINIDEQGSGYFSAMNGGYIHFPIHKTKKSWVFGANFLPQVGIARFGGENELEYGLSLWMELGKEFNTYNQILFQIGSGLHYISAETKRQRGGFIFSDHLNLAYKRKLSNEKIVIGSYFMFRHLSNAGIKEPNFGINNLMIGFMIARTIGSNKKLNYSRWSQLK